jgi:hypothetical protein
MSKSYLQQPVKPSRQAKYRGDIHSFDETAEFKTGAASTFGTFSADLEKIIEQLKIMYCTTSPEDISYPFRVKANIAFAIQRGNAKILRDLATFHNRLMDCPEHLRERANKTILTELNSDHLNDAASEATAYALNLKANSPVCLSPEIDDFDDGLDIDDLMLLNKQSTPISVPSTAPALVCQDNLTHEPNSQLPQPVSSFSQSHFASQF